MRRYGSELTFLYRILADGSGTKPVNQEYMKFARKDSFKLNSLSITHKTFIASGMSSYIVKLKNQP